MTQRKAIESLYIDKCDIIQLVSEKNPINKRTELTEKVVHKAIPCRLSIKNSAIASNSDTGSSVVQLITLFMTPELDIPPGSKFLITHYGRTFKYESSGYPAIYSSHQEIMLQRSDWA